MAHLETSPVRYVGFGFFTLERVKAQVSKFLLPEHPQKLSWWRQGPAEWLKVKSRYDTRAELTKWLELIKK